jgi:GTP cyclohydrolase I
MTVNEGLADIQGGQPTRPLAVDAVGVSHLSYPIVVLDRLQAKQETVATLSLGTNLPATQRGAHLSRLLELLSDSGGELTIRTANQLLATLTDRLGSTTAMIKAEFPYFVEKFAPVTGARGLLDVQTCFSFRGDGNQVAFVLSVTVPVTTLCPCSKAVSDYGAHNQRCSVTVSVAPKSTGECGDDELVWIEDIVELAERHASAPLYPVLKRPDERFVTMQAYDNPAFVEDVVRGVAIELTQDSRISEFFVEASSDESIHNHRAFARVGNPGIRCL